MTLLLCEAGLLRDPLLYLSLYLKQHRAAYYEFLDRVRAEGDGEAWLQFFLEGVRQVAVGAVRTAEHLQTLFAVDRERIASKGRKAGSALRVHDAIKARPIQSITTVSEQTGLSFPTASSAMDLLASLDIVRELTGNRRNRLFAYSGYLDTLTQEGVEG